MECTFCKEEIKDGEIYKNSIGHSFHMSCLRFAEEFCYREHATVDYEDFSDEVYKQAKTRGFDFELDLKELAELIMEQVDMIDTLREFYWFIAPQVEGFGERIKEHDMYYSYLEARRILGLEVDK
jgi:malonyl CoA-acyl carrier protein transacylase